jgi:aminopeptidase 2
VAVLQAVGCSRTAEGVRRALDFNAHGGGVRSQDVMYAVASAASNPAGRRTGWGHLQEHWPAMEARLGGGGLLLARLLSLATDRLASEADADALQAWFEARGRPAGVAVAVAQSAEKIRANAAWVARDGVAVEAWLAAQGCTAEAAREARAESERAASPPEDAEGADDAGDEEGARDAIE